MAPDITAPSSDLDEKVKEDVRAFQSKDSDENIVRETRRCWGTRRVHCEIFWGSQGGSPKAYDPNYTILGFAPWNNWNRLGAARQDLFAFTGGDDVDIVWKLTQQGPGTALSATP